MAKVPRETKLKVWKRDGYRCRYCKRTLTDPGPGVPLHLEASVDHVKPRSLGGSNQPDNLVTACRQCNQAKGSGAEVIVKPRKAGAALRMGWR